MRGNQPAIWKAIKTARSIPACAGEPCGLNRRSRSASVYPRVCGGTSALICHTSQSEGLSPRVRGNRTAGAADADGRGSIPACAGEPHPGGDFEFPGGVYPRVCGGTSIVPLPARSIAGLSPRVRGNHRRITRPRTNVGVYPRVCGGTCYAFANPCIIRGLSPRVRGNPQPPSQPLHHPGSIPACAGEPNTGPEPGKDGGVYPRVCGGTLAPADGIVGGVGLSPRVRGNRRLAQRPDIRARSIPACAGEPAAGDIILEVNKVYPRVCGGTPWPFDNASCYLIRRGNNGDPLAVTYQIHPSASTVSFGRFPQRQYPPHARRRRRPGHWL